MRLCNKQQLEVINEFSNELLLYIPYYYYLYSNNLLFDNKIITYNGMKPLYYFIDSNNLIEKKRRRRNIPPLNRALLVNKDGNVKNLDKKYWIPPPYKSIYKNNLIKFNKPILVLHNKYNIEWNKTYINFIDVETLQHIFNELKDKFQIIYIRPSNKIKHETYSYDLNESFISDELKDYELIDNEFSDTVIKFDDLIKQYNYIYNELLFMLYSNCENFISNQGGGSLVMSFFFTKMLIFHKSGGGELKSGAYNNDGWFHDTNKEENKILKICRNYDEIKNNLNIFEI